MNTRLSRFTLALASSSLMMAGSAIAEESQLQRPFRGLFSGKKSQKQSMDLSINAYAGYDDNILAGQAGVGLDTAIDPRFQVSGSYAGIEAGLSYSRNGQRVSLGASAGSAMRFYGSLTDARSLDHHAGIGLSVKLSPRTSLQLSQSAGFSPYYFDGGVPALGEPQLGEVRVPSADRVILNRTYLSFGTSAGVSHQLRRDLALGVDHTFSYVSFSGKGLDLGSHSTSVSLSRPVSRYMAFQGGYSHGVAYYGQLSSGGGNVSVHTHTLGMGLSRQFSRTTALHFVIGSTVVLAGELFRTNRVLATEEGTRGGSSTTATDDSAVYSVSGAAGVSHTFGKGWAAEGVFERAVQFIPGFQEPVSVNAGVASISRALSSRLGVSGSFMYSTGSVGLRGFGNGYDTYGATVGVHYAVRPSVGIVAQYVNFHYKFDEFVDSLLRLPRELTRQGALVGLSFGFPIF